jgi:hypothetical protein
VPLATPSRSPEDYFEATPSLENLAMHAQGDGSLTAVPKSILSCSKLVRLQLQENSKLASLPDGTWPASLETLFIQVPHNPCPVASPRRLAPMPRPEPSLFPEEGGGLLPEEGGGLLPEEGGGLQNSRRLASRCEQGAMGVRSRRALARVSPCRRRPSLRSPPASSRAPSSSVSTSRRALSTRQRMGSPRS